MKAKLFISLITIFFMSCNSYEKLGDFKYKIITEKVNTGDFDALIEHIKSYHSIINDTFLFGYTIKAQKLHFESKKDTVYTIGKFKYDNINKTITTTEIFQNGYEKAVQTDSIKRIFIQKQDGSIVLKDYFEYKNGVKK